jgi:hypothetical protein
VFGEKINGGKKKKKKKNAQSSFDVKMAGAGCSSHVQFALLREKC